VQSDAGSPTACFSTHIVLLLPACRRCCLSCLTLGKNWLSSCTWTNIRAALPRAKKCRAVQVGMAASQSCLLWQWCILVWHVVVGARTFNITFLYIQSTMHELQQLSGVTMTVGVWRQ
jgi:hypothetical protein